MCDASLEAMASEVFASPESITSQQVMSPSPAAALLEGEVSAPNYGAVAASGGSGSVQVNGFPNSGGDASAAVRSTIGSRDDSLPGPSRLTSLGEAERVTGPAVTTLHTGPDATTYPRGNEAGITREPQGPVGMHRSQQSPLTPVASPTTTTPPPDTQQQQQQLWQRPLLQDQGSVLHGTPSPNPSPTQYPDPGNIPQPIQVVRSWTAQMASAAASMSQRMQFQAVLGQGQVGIGTQNAQEDFGGGMAFDPGFQGYPIHPLSDPPPLPRHFQAEPGRESSRNGVFAGIARAGQVLRRRVLEPVFQQVSRTSVPQSPQVSSEVPVPQVEGDRPHQSLFQPAVAEAMQEWTSRRSLIAPGPSIAPVPELMRDEVSTGSLSSELVRMEVKKQVQLAMAEKDSELRELRQQNERLRRTLQSPSAAASGEGVGQDQGFLGGGRHGGLGLEPNPNPASRVPGGPVFQGVPRQVLDSARESGGNLPSAGVPESVPAGCLGGLPERGGQGGGSSGAQEQQAYGPMHMPSTSSGAVAEEPLQLLVQGMRQLQQAYIGKTDARDSELKGTAEVPEMPDTGPEASVAFADWLYETEQAVGSLSDKASIWFSACLEVARQAYAEYSLASPLNRLAMQPVIPEALKDGKWARLERKVMTLLLGSMKKAAKEDAVTHRIVDVPSLLFRLHVLYQPGGVSERAAVLKHLEGKPIGEDVHECIAALRKWRRYLERAEAMHVTVPDASILLRALEVMIKRVLAAFPEVKFRVDLTKNELQLQGRPTLEAVLRFYTHVLAELQMIAPVSLSTSSATLKAIGSGQSGGTGETSSPTSSPTKKGGVKTPCKFFSSRTGCVKGSACKFEHAFESKEDKKTRCWECGSQGHRKSDCPVVTARVGKTQRPQGKNEHQASSSMASTTTATSMADTSPALKQQAILESIQAVQQAVDGIATSSSHPASPHNAIQQSSASSAPTASPGSEDPDVKELIKEANAMLSKLTKLQVLEVKTNESIGALSAAIKAAGLDSEEGFALLDSGASHAFKVADSEAMNKATPVRVELAGGQYVTLKQNKAGTLLAASDDPDAARATSILPLGALVQELGCDLTWTRKGGLKVVHPQFGVLKTFVKGNHPMLVETQALSIISQLEDMQLQSLEAQTAETFVRTLDVEEMRTWDFMLDKFVATGERVCLLEALSSTQSPLGPLPQQILSLAAIHVGLDDKQGWKYLKALPLNRAARKAMMTKRWVVRLYRREGEADVSISNSEEAIVIDCNVARSKRFSLKGDSAVYKALMWAAARGQIEGIFGSPPVNDGMELLTKQLLLWMVARQGATIHGFPPPYLLLGSTPASYMWKLDMWSSFRQEYHVPMMQVESQKDGNNYLIATNLAMRGGLLSPTCVEVPEGLAGKAWPNVWKKPFQHEIGVAVDRWRLKPEEMFLGYMLHKMDSGDPWTDKDLRYWRRHVANGHLPFDRRCKTCVQTAATGRAHRRVVAPSCYTLSLDVCGPFRKKGEYGGSKGFRYALIGTYLMPKLDGYKDIPIPENPDLEPDEAPPEEEDFLEEQGPQDLPMDPQDQADMDKFNAKFQALYKEVGDTMEYQALHFAIPLKSRLTPEIEQAVKQVYLQIRSEGLPVTRVHSDRARELRGSKLRAWLFHRDVLPTTGEAQAPQTNGRAEAGVRRAKTRTKTLLRAAGLDSCCWPYAMTFAAFQQREWALGRSKGMISFGSPVLVKSKVYGTGGKFDLDERWQNGIYVGPSHEVRQGHVVRFPSGRIVTSMHIRPNIEDPDTFVPLAAVEAYLPAPLRRVTGKRPLRAREAAPEGDLLDPPEVPSDHEVPSGRDIGHAEAAGAWTDEEAPMVGFLDKGVSKFIMYEASGDPLDPAEVPSDHEVPSGRDLGCVAVRALKPLTEPERKAEELAASYLKAGVMGTVLVMQLFETLEEAQQIFSRASRRKSYSKATSWATGAFTHGGVTGLRDGAKRLPNVTRFLAKFAREVMGAKQFAALVVQRNGGGQVHRDFHNRPGAKNWLCPLTSFQGGGLWTEIQDQETSKFEGDMVVKEVRPGVKVKGRIIEVKRGKSFSFDPMRWHEVQPHQGERVMMIAYTPRLSNFSKVESDYLMDLGFLPFGEEEHNIEQGGVEAEQSPKEDPEGDEHACSTSLINLNEAHCQLLEDLQERGQTLRLLLEEERLLAEDLQQAGDLVAEEAEKVQEFVEQLYKRASLRISASDRAVLKVCLKAAAEPSDPDYEQLLELLESDLQVVHTVPLSQVKPVVERWHAAISKELGNLIQGGTLEEISREEAQRLEGQGVLRLVPSKSVFTLKPPGGGDGKYKRKYRLVLCGNFAAPEEMFGSLYAGGASAETFRTILALAGLRNWLGATADITGAFLLAPWPEHLHSYAVVPPRLLIDNGYVSKDAYWLVKRPLYGLRESPAIWAAYRSSRLSRAKIPYLNKHLVLRVSKVDPELWLIFFDNETNLLGCIITYVDDLFYVSVREIVVAVHAWVLEEWPCSPLEWASAVGGTRYLGMEVVQRSSGAFEIHQKGYILDLLRSHGMQDTPGTLLPCPKEWVADDISPEPEDFNEPELRFAQRMVGEQLWLTMRCRPDIQFVVGHMAQWVAKHPRRVTKIAKRVLAYLSSTTDLKLILGEDHGDGSTSSGSSTAPSTSTNQTAEVALIGYSDSSFAPFGDRSYGASVVTVNNGPVAWKSGKQSLITLSTMESELLEATTAAVLLESVGVLLDEVLGRRVQRFLRVDNSAATAMLQGGAGSWRTRHLKVRSGYVREQVAHGLLQVESVEGRYQLADLATKMHPRARLLDLLRQWGFEGMTVEDVCVQLARAVALHCILAALERVPQANGQPDEEEPKAPLPSSGIDELLLVSGVVALVAVVLWELIKWLVRCIRRTTRRESKLRRLRELARLTAELEIERIEEHSQSASREVQEAVQAVVTAQGSQTPLRHARTEDRALESPRPRTPEQVHLEPQTKSSPGNASSASSVGDDLTRHLDRERLCKDVLFLMHCDALKTGLRAEGMTLSGLKPELVARLALRLLPDPAFAVQGRVLPTERQLRYVLWLWKHGRLQMRCQLQWCDLYNRESISNWIRLWKEMAA